MRDDTPQRRETEKSRERYTNNGASEGEIIVAHLLAEKRNCRSWISVRRFRKTRGIFVDKRFERWPPCGGLFVDTIADFACSANDAVAS